MADVIGVIFFGHLFLNNFSRGAFAVPGDFACFRAAGKLVATEVGGHAEDIAKVCEYTYPPPFLFLVRPLALLPAPESFVVWTVAGLTAFIFAARRVGVPLAAVALAMVSPVSLYGLAIGQNGFFTSALLLLSLGCVEASPILAGLGAGALIIKPHLAMLLPVCFLAARNYTAFVVAAVTAGGMGLSSVLFFGPATWVYFIYHELAVAGTIMSRPWPFGQSIMVSPFVEAHSLGSDVPTAMLVQGMATLAAAVLTWRLWRRRWTGNPLARLLATLALAFLSVPHDCIYDLSAMAAVLAAYGMRDPRYGLEIFAAFCLLMAVYALLSFFTFSTGAMFLVVVAAYGASEARLQFANSTT